MPTVGGELLERGECLAAIDAVVKGVRSGAGRMLLFEGPAGIGKTTLLDEAQLRAHGFTVLRASGGELERDLPLGVVRQLFEPTLWRASGLERERWLRGPSASAGQLLGTPAQTRFPADSAAVRSGIYWLAVALAEEAPLLLLVDDLHWVDSESLRWVMFAARRLRDTGIGLVMATRAREPGAEESLLAALATLPGLPRVRLAPLSAGATEELVGVWSRPRTAAQAFAATCHQLSGGNPFLLAQLLEEASRVGIEPDLEDASRLETLVPEGLARAVLLRLRALGDGAVSLARAAALLGPGVGLGPAAELGGLPVEQAAGEADALIRAGVLRDSEQLATAHPLLRGAILGELTSTARAALHARAARVLAASGAAPELVGAQLLAAAPCRDPWVVDQLMAAAEQARARGAPEAAARLLQRALDEPPAPDRAREIHAALGSALSTAGDARGIEHIRTARELTEDPVQRARLGMRMGTPYMFLGRGEEVEAMLRSGLDELGDGSPPLAFSLRSALASLPAYGARFDPRGLVAALTDEAAALDPLPVFLRPPIGALAMVACAGAFPARVVARTARLAIGDLAAHRAAVAAGFPLLPALMALGLADDVAGLDERLDLAEDGLRTRGAIALGLCMLLATRSGLRLGRGSIDAAVDLAAAAVELSTESEFTWLRAQALVLYAIALRERGDLTGAERALADCPAAGGGMWAAAAQEELAAIALARGDHASALRQALAAGEWMDQIGHVNPVLVRWRSVAALAMNAGGDSGGAARLAAEQIEHARAFGTPAAVGMALRIHGLVLGEPELLAQAERTLAGSPRRLEHARALIDLGAALRRRGERVRARDPLFAGMESARRCGAEPLARRAMTELRAAGARPRNVVRSGVEALTPSELRVATLAARGQTNREIAAELFVTKATVESHLRSIFRKLDITARSELGDHVGGDQLTARVSR